MKMICLVRHVDSQKNRRELFDADSVEQGLTPQGETEILHLIRSLRELHAEFAPETVQVFSANSDRARQTAQRICGEFRSSLSVVTELTSIGSGPISGMSESDVAGQYPDYMHALELYRSGVVSSANIPRPHGCEGLDAFEHRMARCLNTIAETDCDLGIVVAHRSPITAICILLAREFLSYPKGFFGYIPLPTGSMTLFDYGSGTFKFVGRVDAPSTKTQAIRVAEQVTTA